MMAFIMLMPVTIMNLYLSFTEARQMVGLIQDLRARAAEFVDKDDERHLREMIGGALKQGLVQRDIFDQNPVQNALKTALLGIDEIGLKHDSIVSTLLYPHIQCDEATLRRIRGFFGEDVVKIISGLSRIHDLYKKNPVVESENFRNLLLSFAEDMRVILIMIASRVNLMRQIRDTSALDAQRQVAEEASYLYAPLAHKLGLYKLKSELEDLSLKYLEHDAYYLIKEKLNETKKSRDAYIKSFIAPIQEKLEQAGLTFHMKGRTKSIHSIWQKMKKQKCGFEGIYDLFAIRIILESPMEAEKMHCWQVYSLITDMYQPNPKRLRDWLSVPKSNGYESLHITVLGPENKWVEVQIRTARMDDIAERGLAAHWRYKGIKGENGLDEWLNSIRNALETSDNLRMIDQFKMDLYEDEVYVFTPRGDLFKFPKGATVLDFAFHVHSNVGSHCVGAKINGKNVSIREVLKSGDQVEILTSNAQKPKMDWLNIVKSSRAKSKIRLALKVDQDKNAHLAKEILERRFKNRKIDMDEALMAQVVKKLGFKETSDFYRHIASQALDVAEVIEKYVELRDNLHLATEHLTQQSVQDYTFALKPENALRHDDDVLVIDQNLKDVDFALAKCCNPIFGDPIFGFVTVNGGIKVHRENCPNAPELRKRFGYRVVRAKWSGKGNAQYSAAIRIVGNDDLGILNNITNVISKEEQLTIRNINVDSRDGLFCGNIVVRLDAISRLDVLLKKIRTIKGVRSAERL